MVGIVVRELVVNFTDVCLNPFIQKYIGEGDDLS